ncbi:MAG: 16S rRNA (cytosine(1402)-N(4))-methyltransferase [Candidatus Pelagibacter sp.]|nr:16S rRNA (cytosine(1402)-N(4))-methyltransferase [Candidatus Pelagibacter sp.]OUV96295.1 MAG: 16S rRNA (cytosine(1402)-N(4))-methyltransferase [Candidatus Pelagibacter sp. TMED142]
MGDRLVKNIFNFYGKSLNYSRYLPSINKINTFKIITKKPIKPSNKEIVINPNSRSAKLRVIKKINNERVSISINNTGMEKYLTLESQINE